MSSALYISQISVFPFLQIGNFNLEVFIKFMSAIIFAVKPHLDEVFTVFLPVRWIQPLLLFWSGPGYHGYTVSRVHSIRHLWMYLFVMEFCIRLCFFNILIESHHFRLWWQFWPTMIDLQRKLLLNSARMFTDIWNIVISSWISMFRFFWQFKKQFM